MKPFPKVLLSQPSAMCAKVRDAGQKVFGELTAQEEAQYEPFRKVLSGDKLDLYNRRLKSYKLYGLGGKVLKTPGRVSRLELVVYHRRRRSRRHRAGMECRLLALQRDDEGRHSRNQDRVRPTRRRRQRFVNSI